ncbi:hypothetical protein E2C01_015755 [Portunus trituberculatus]|uniref:Uncharacterized protein n=1 Tax=Portunus trituberculatus TaxID=210409 RepID=A0A5B7DNX0_PORTR|nr:hypothetical protein [Portunus trituberculatus]
MYANSRAERRSGEATPTFACQVRLLNVLHSRFYMAKNICLHLAGRQEEEEEEEEEEGRKMWDGGKMSGRKTYDEKAKASEGGT